MCSTNMVENISISFLPSKLCLSINFRNYPATYKAEVKCFTVNTLTARNSRKNACLPCQCFYPTGVNTSQTVTYLSVAVCRKHCG